METEGTQEREEEIGDSKKHGQRVLCTCEYKHCYESQYCVQCQLKISKYSKGLNMKVLNKRSYKCRMISVHPSRTEPSSAIPIIKD